MGLFAAQLLIILMAAIVIAWLAIGCLAIPRFCQLLRLDKPWFVNSRAPNAVPLK